MLQRQWKNRTPRQTVAKVAPQRSFKRLVASVPVTPAHASSGLDPIFDQKDISEVHKQIANEAYQVIPARCRVIKNFYVREPENNPKPPKHRGLAGKFTMILSGFVSNQEFRALFFHEVAHVISLNPSTNCLGGTPESGKSEFADGNDPVYNDSPMLEYNRISWVDSYTRKADAVPEEFCSGYGGALMSYKADVFEGFAECHTLFVLHNAEFRKLAQKNNRLALKYNWFLKHLYPNGIQAATSQHAFGAKRDWDNTKLPYIWKRA